MGECEMAELENSKDLIKVYDMIYDEKCEKLQNVKKYMLKKMFV